MSKKRILVVDDDITTLRLLKIGLESTGLYQVREESKGTRACATALEFQPDMIVLDICMPDIDGGDVAAQIHDQPRLRSTPIVFLSSIISPEEAEAHAMNSGGFKFLAKPVKIRQLVQHIEESLGTTAAASVA